VAHRQGSFLSAATLASLAFLAPAYAQTRADCEREYTPQRGQEGKDVVWVPTEDAMLVRMLELASLGPADKVYDLGSGDGKIPIAAAKLFGATAVGIEYEPDLVLHARCLAAAERVEDRVTFVQGDLFAADFSDATVVTLYLLPEMNVKLRPTLLAMKPGTRVVSYSFTMGDWEPDESIDSFGHGSAFFWLVPANARGRWSFVSTGDGERFELDLHQTFQMLHGSAGGGASAAGRLRGDRIELAFGENGAQALVAGTVEADRIVATVTREGTTAEYVGTRR
jgi:SAM-dependent methyltransferase